MNAHFARPGGPHVFQTFKQQVSSETSRHQTSQSGCRVGNCRPAECGWKLHSATFRGHVLLKSLSIASACTHMSSHHFFESDPTQRENQKYHSLVLLYVPWPRNPENGHSKSPLVEVGSSPNMRYLPEFLLWHISYLIISKSYLINKSENCQALVFCSKLLHVYKCQHLLNCRNL